MSTTRIAPKRWLAQILLLACLIIVPFVSIHGNPFFRIDIFLRTFFIAGVPVRIDQFYLVLLITLASVAGFLVLTALLGRVWCGWFCPQTVFNDLADLAKEKLQKLLPSFAAAAIWHFCLFVLSASVSALILCWFMSPAALVKNLSEFSSHPVIFLSLILLSLLMYLNLVVVKRSFCRSYCPYGRFQTALMDDGTLNLAFLEETQDRCLRCSSCVRVCPMGIDIRHGFQIECINCGRCIDACRNIMDRRDGSDGLIAYRFGLRRDNRIKIGTKTAVLILMSALICSATVWSVSNRSDTAFSVQRIATSENRQMSDGSQVQAWRAIIGNRGTVEQLYSIVVSPQSPGMQVRLLGPVTAIRIAPNENRQVGFSIQYASAAVKQQISLELRSSGVPVAQAKVQP